YAGIPLPPGLSGVCLRAIATTRPWYCEYSPGRHSPGGQSSPNPLSSGTNDVRCGQFPPAVREALRDVTCYAPDLFAIGGIADMNGRAAPVNSVEIDP